MHLLLPLCILALCIHSVVLEYNCVRVANDADVSIEVGLWDINRSNTENVTIASGSYHAFATQSGVFYGITLTKDDSDLIPIGFNSIFKEHEYECTSREVAVPAAVPTVPGACHKPPCCKTTLSIGLDHRWTIKGKTVNVTANPHIVWTCEVSKSTFPPLRATPEAQTTEHDIAGCNVYFFNDTTDIWQALTNQDQILTRQDVLDKGFLHDDEYDDVEMGYADTDEFPLTVFFTDAKNIKWKVEMRSPSAALTMCVPKSGNMRFFGDETGSVDLSIDTKIMCLKFYYDPEDWFGWAHDIEIEAWGYTDPNHAADDWLDGTKWPEALELLSTGLGILSSLAVVIGFVG